MLPDHPRNPHDSPEAPRRAAKSTGMTLAVVLLAGAVTLGCAGWLEWPTITRSAHASADSSANASASATGTGAARATGSPAAAAAAASQSSAALATAAKPLKGKTVVIDPGHNPDNYKYPHQINSRVWIGNGYTSCDTTGTSTNSGYPEADFTLDVARRVRAILQAEGAKVVFTQDGNLAWGPCVTQRAAIGNAAHANAAISIHGDGAPASDHGFHVILPALVDTGGANTRSIVTPSHTLGVDVRSAFAKATKEPFANYVNGGTGMIVRHDLGGLNMSRVPKIFIECGNMRNATDAREMTTAAWRERAAQGIAAGLAAFLESGH